MPLNPERERLLEHNTGKGNWKRWSPTSANAPGEPREDYSANGDAWNYFPHAPARSRAYRWNEDGLGGFFDDHLRRWGHHAEQSRTVDFPPVEEKNHAGSTPCCDSGQRFRRRWCSQAP